MTHSSSSFYVTLNSRANVKEFPDNKPYRFKNRLHHPLILREPGWRVGLSSLCLPAVKPDLHRNVLPDQGDKALITWAFWSDVALPDRKRKYVIEEVQTDVKQMEMWGYVTSGVTMMTFFADLYNRFKSMSASKGDKMVSSTGKKYHFDVKMEGDELVIDNSNVHRSIQNGRPIIKFNKKLALKMKWFTDTGDQHYNLKLGPNLIMSFYDPTIPDVLDVVDEEDDNKTIFWKEDGEDVRLSVFCNWRFVNLNEAFRANWQVDDRTLYALSDVASSSIVGDKTEDLLRSFHYKRQTGCDMFHFEPQTIHYLPVRKSFFEIVETSFTETDGRQVKFNSGDCTLGLHFKRDFLATT